MSDLEHDDEGVTMVGRLALPAGDGPIPAVLVALERADFEAEMRAVEVDWQLDVYEGAKHRFTDARAAYRVNATAASGVATRKLKLSCR